MSPHFGGSGATGTGASGGSLRDYWTDGSVARLCATLSELTGVRIELRDERGIVLDPDQSAEFFGGRIEPIDSSATVFPVRIGGDNGTVIGSSLLMETQTPSCRSTRATDCSARSKRRASHRSCSQ